MFDALAELVIPLPLPWAMLEGIAGEARRGAARGDRCLGNAWRVRTDAQAQVPDRNPIDTEPLMPEWYRFSR